MRDVRAIITGQSRGLGAAIATQLLERGASVLGIARGRAEIPAGIDPERFPQLPLDLADPGALAEWIAGGELDLFLSGGTRLLLINNAGTLQPVGPLPAQEVSSIASAIALNVTAALMLSAAFVAGTPQSSDRRILHISSGAARHPYAGWSIYCASKAALDQHARAVALDRVAGLRIASVAPGIIDTQMQAEVRATPPELFPDRSRFLELKENDQLEDPARVAARLIEMLLADDFGREPVTDLRARAGD